MTTPPPPDRVTLRLPARPAPNRMTVEAVPGQGQPVSGMTPARDPARATSEWGSEEQNPGGASDQPPAAGSPGADDPATGWPAAIRDHTDQVEPLSGQPGGQAELYRARWDGTQQVVIKVFHRARPDADSVWRLWRLAGDGDRAVVPLVTACTAGTRDYEVTPYQEHRDLAHHLRERGAALSDEEARAVLGDLADALAYLHDEVSVAAAAGARALVHGDVKPANLLVLGTDPLRVGLTDFGIARVQQFTQEEADRDMTPEYAAPERFRFQRSPAVDWWALGMTMLELVQGEHPFVVDGGPLSPGSISNHISYRAVPVNDTVAAPWRLVLSGLLTYSPERRWTGAEIHSWLAGETPDVDTGIGHATDEDGPEFSFAGGVVRGPGQLAEALTTHWRAAGDLVLGGDWVRLRDWAAETSPRVLAAVEEVDLHFVQTRAPVDRIVAELVVRFDQHSRVSFRGFAVDRYGLAQLCRAVEEGDEEAARALRALHQSRSLQALSRLPDGQGLDLVDEQWHTWYGLAREFGRHLMGRRGELPAEHRLLDVTLRAAVDRVFAENLAARVDVELTADDRQRPAFQDVMAERGGPNAPAADAALLLAAHAPVTVPDAGQPVAADAEAMGRQLHAEIDRMVADGWAADDWLPAAPDARPPGLDRGSPARRGVRPLVLVASVAVLWAVLVGLGVAATGHPVEGVSFGLVLLVATGVLCAGLTRPSALISDAMVGGAFGAFWGVVAAALVGVPTGLVLGRAVGTGAFWWAWLCCVVLGAVLGVRQRTEPEDEWW